MKLKNIESTYKIKKITIDYFETFFYSLVRKTYVQQQFPTRHKSQHIYQKQFPHICPFLRSPKCENYVLVIIQRFFEGRTFFFGIVVKNATNKKVAPSSYFKFSI